MRSKWFGLFGIILVITLVAGPLAGGALAAGDHGDAHAGHDMSIIEDMSHDSLVSENEEHGDEHAGHDMDTMDDNYHDNSVHTGDDHGGHGGELQDPNTPPNWPVIYGFGGFNLLVMIVAALLKSKATGVN